MLERRKMVDEVNMLYNKINELQVLLDHARSQINEGEWIIDEERYGRVWHCRCSNCNKDPRDYIGGSETWWLVRLPNCCPHCGAKMKGEDDEVD